MTDPAPKVPPPLPPPSSPASGQTNPNQASLDYLRQHTASALLGIAAMKFPGAQKAVALDAAMGSPVRNLLDQISTDAMKQAGQTLDDLTDGIADKLDRLNQPSAWIAPSPAD